MKTSRRRRPRAAPFPDQINNRLLLALPQGELARLRPNLELVDLPRGHKLLRPSAPIDYVYFPQECIVSLVLPLEGESVIEVGLVVVGKEGMVGALAPLGATAMLGEARVGIAGSALRMRAGVLRTEAGRNRSLMDLLLRYAQALFAQVSQSVACNSRHQLRERMARWLLMAHDCMDGDELPLTHEFLATMLGVRRAGITVAVGQLREAGLIDSRRGRFSILDRRGLEASACGCYRAVKGQYERLLSSPQPE